MFKTIKDQGKLCDLCSTDKRRAKYDAPLAGQTWGYACEVCFEKLPVLQKKLAHMVGFEFAPPGVDPKQEGAKL